MAAGPRRAILGLVAGLFVLLAPGLAAATCTYNVTFTGTGSANAQTISTISSGGACDQVGLGLAKNLNDDLSVVAPLGFDDPNNTNDQQFTLSPASSPATAHATITVDGVSMGPGDATNLKFTLVSTGGATSDTVTVFAASGASGANADTVVNITFNLPASAPTVTSVSPPAGSTAAGTSITISGTGFDSTPSNNTVRFGATAASVASASATSLTVTAPAHAAGTVDVTVTTIGGTSATSASDHFTFVTPPTIAASFSPTATAVGSTATLTLTLSNPSGGTFTSLAESTTLPAGLSASSPSTTCGGTASVGGGGVLNLSGGSLAGASCTVTATVTATSSGSKTLTPGGSAAPSGGQAGGTMTGVAGSTATLTVNAALTTTQAVPSTTLTVGVAATPFTPVTASGGTGTISYALSGATLPTGVSFSTSTGQVTGTPSTILSATIFTVTATDQTVSTPQTSSKTFSLTVAKGTNTISFTGPGTTSLSASPVAVSATGLSSAAVVFSSTTLPVCTVSGTSVTLVSTGTCSITAHQAGDANWNAAAPVSQSFTVTGLTLTTTQAVPSTSLTVNVAATPFTPVTAAGGTGTVSFALSGATLPTGLSFSTSTGEITGTPSTALSATIFTVTATDQTVSTPQTSSKTFSLTVAKGTNAITFTGPGTTALSASPVVVSATGLSSAAVVFSSTTLPVCTVSGTSVTLVSTGTCSITANQAGDANWNAAAPVTQPFTVSAAVVALTTTQAVPSITLTVGVAATPFTPVTASGGMGTVSFALSGATLPSGLSFSTSTGQITGTPGAALSATVFTVTATDQTVSTPQTSSKTFSLTVAKGANAITFTGPGATALSASPVAVSATGFSSAAVVFSSTTLPVCTVSGTSVALVSTGTCSITANQAGDANWNAAAPVSRAFTVSAGTPIAGAIGVEVASNSSNNAISLDLSGGAATSVAVSTPAKHGVATASGTVITYTPTTGFSGTDTFQYTATNGGGTSSPALVTVTVKALPVPTAAPQSATVMAGQAVDINATTGATGGPFTVAAIVTPPDHGTVAVKDQTLTYTAPATFAGAATFTYSLANAFGASAPATVTVTVNPTPIAPATTNVTILPGRDGSVDLTAGATGGPFTAAAVVSVSPAQAGTTTILVQAASASAAAPADPVSEGSRSPASASPADPTPGAAKSAAAAPAPEGRRYILTFKAAPGFSGVATVTFTLSNAFGTSAPARIVYDIPARPDPTLNPDVAGLVAAQAETARRFGEAQIENFDRRLETLHREGRDRFTQGVSFGLGDDPADPWEAARRQRDAGLRPPAQDRRAQAVAAVDPRAPASAETRDLHPAPSNLATWSGGAIDLGLHGGAASRSKFRFTTSGVSVGADYRLNDQLTLGAGMGYGRDQSRIGSNGSKVDAETYMGAIYGSYRPDQHAFVDVVVGYGALDFDTRRNIAVDSTFATGRRHGAETFASVTAGYDFQRGSLSVSTYGRLDSINGALDAFTESEPGGGTNALSFDRQSLSLLTSTLGLRGAYAIRAASGLWSPHARLEYKYDFQTAGLASLHYADDAAGATYTTGAADPRDQNRFVVEVGADLHRGATAYSLDYRANFNGRDEFVHQIAGRVVLRF